MRPIVRVFYIVYSMTLYIIIISQCSANQISLYPVGTAGLKNFIGIKCKCRAVRKAKNDLKIEHVEGEGVCDLGGDK